MYTTTYHNRIQLAIKLNSHAVTLIQNGRFESAFPILSAALKASKEAISDSPVDEDIAMYPNRTSLDGCMLPSSRPNSSTDVDQSSPASDEQYVYGSCILIPSSIQATYESGIQLVSVAIMFNLALAHQLLAESMNQSKKLLNKAVKLYELAYNLQREECMENTSFFCLATINNLGLIFKCLHKSENAAKCFQHLLSMLMFLVDCGESKQVSEYDGFFRNTSHLICEHKTAAAA
jgi:tetratricopeptide (TPR) repeat protein